MSAKFPIGIRVEFLNSRYNTNDYRFYDSNLKYNEGGSGFVISVSDETEMDENSGIDEFHYTILVDGENIINVPESDLTNPNASLTEKVEQRLRQKQANKKYQDTEGRIGGSKKQRMAYKLVSLEDLKEIEKDEATAIDLIKKDKVYPRLNINIEIDNGVSSGTAFLKTKMREFYPPEPIKGTRRDIYVGVANYLVTQQENLYTHHQFTSFINYIKSNFSNVLIEVLDNELFENIKQLKEDRKIQKQLLEEKLAQAEANVMKELLSLKEKFPQFIERHYFDVEEVPSEDRKQFDVLYEEEQNLKNQYNNLRVRFIDEEIQFINSLGYNFFDMYAVEDRLIKDILGERFYNFLYDKNDYFNKAIQYNPLSEGEARIYLDKSSYSNKLKYVEKKENLLKEINKYLTLDEIKNFFVENSTFGFGGGYFPVAKKNKFFEAKDIKTIKDAEAYRERWEKVVKEEIDEDKKNAEDLKKKYSERDNDWSWHTEKKSTEKNKKSELKINTIPPLSFIKRVGGYEITEDDINPQFIKDKFGFKNVEFGQSLKDEEAKEHIRHFLGAMADLGDILDLDIIKFNKIGGLSIAFASRGGGKASATYDGLYKIINITKSRGGGALAHEYMHYIDNIIPKINRENYTYEDWASESKTDRWGYETTRKINNSSVSEIVDKIFEFINYGFDTRKGRGEKIKYDVFVDVKIPKNDTIFNISKRKINSNNELESIEEYLQRFFDLYPFHYKYENLNKKSTKQILGSILSMFDLDEYVFKLKSNTSRYYANSVAMSSPYWIKPWELFARAFETYIFDKLQKAGRSNNYLVSGAYFDREEGVYPYGIEREILFDLFDLFIESIKHYYDLKGFKTWTSKRVDEYFALEEDSTEKSGIIVDEETGEVLEKVGDYTELQKKFIKLAKMLNSKKNNNKKK
jgi:hypothetical protein